MGGRNYCLTRQEIKVVIMEQLFHAIRTRQQHNTQYTTVRPRLATIKRFKVIGFNFDNVEHGQ